MNKKIIFGISITIILIFFSISPAAMENNQNTKFQNNNILKNMIKLINYHYQNILYEKLWFPGFFITLLLAPFIILYLIIAIILDIGNP